MVKVDGHAGLFFWMRRVAEEHNKISESKLKRVQELFFQTTTFKEMPEETQDKVIRELVDDMINLGWGDEVSEYFPEYSKVVK